MPTDYVIVLTTLPDEADASAFARALVEERLAACVNVLPPMRSTYRWEGRVEEASERQMVMKTERTRLDALRTRVHELHSYDTPEFLVIPVAGGSERYLEWMSQSLNVDDRPL